MDFLKTASAQLEKEVTQKLAERDFQQYKRDIQAIENQSGITPYDLKVLIKPDKVEEKTAGGIILAAQTKDAEQYASVKATVIAMGENAFKEWGDINKPKVGQRVMAAKYSGLNIKGDDKEDYRLCNDEDIVAGIS